MQSFSSKLIIARTTKAQAAMFPEGGAYSLPSCSHPIKPRRGTRERHGPRAPPLCENMLDWDTDQIVSASASDQLITTQLIRVRIGRPFDVGRVGAEWRWVDVEVGQELRRRRWAR